MLGLPAHTLESTRARAVIPMSSFIQQECVDSVVVKAAQRERLINFRLQACKRKASQLALLDGFMPRLRQPGSLGFAISPIAFNPETAPNADVLKLLHARPCQRFQNSFSGIRPYLLHRWCADEGSVTGMIHAFSQPFDADVVITKMMNGSHWPRAGYTQKSFHTWYRLDRPLAFGGPGAS